MRCPACQGSLATVLVLETMAADRPVYIDHQWWRCGDCGQRYFAVLVEDKTNIFNDDLEHEGWRPEGADWERTLAEAGACPRPRDKRCTCPVHRAPPRCWGTRAW